MDNATDPPADLLPAMEHACRTLSREDRGVLRLLYSRGATQREVAAALGISRACLRRRVRLALAKARDPLRVALARHGGRLTPGQRRLVFLSRVVGLPLREIARRRLVDDLGRDPGPPSRTTLARELRRAVRRLRRADGRSRRSRGMPARAPAPDAPAAPQEPAAHSSAG